MAAVLEPQWSAMMILVGMESEPEALQRAAIREACDQQLMRRED
jgi:hypothetical protein